MPRVDSSKTVTSLGVGRVDYSQSVEQSVEPIIRGWQSGYNAYKTFTVGAGDTHIEEILIDSTNIIIVYDFYLSCYPSADLSFEVDFYSRLGNWINIVNKQGTQCVDVRLSKGWPMARKWRIIVINNGGGAVDCYFSAHGITTSETEYYGSQASTVDTMHIV
jgi:hypothetical protein